MSHSISKETFTFLSDLQANNNREWFETNKNLYLAAKDNMILFMDAIIENMSTTDPEMLRFEGKKALFRIFRDVRFSLDKTPYKNHFGAALGMGKNNQVSGYYLHVAPGNSFLAGGVYAPQKEDLKKIRTEISENPSEFLQIINADAFKEKVLALYSEDKLKRIPQGFDKEHPLEDFLKLKSFVAKHILDDAFLQQPGSAKKLAEISKLLKPLNAYIEKAIQR